MTSSAIVALLVGYLFVLLVVGWRLETHGGIKKRARLRGMAYGLSLAAICTSWTYFDGVGRTIRNGRIDLPSLLGPVLALTLFFPIWRRIAEAARRENIGSIADFFSSRYGKSRVLAKLIAAVAVVGALPYIALQLVAVSGAWAALAGRPDPAPYYAPVIIAGLAVFAILLGARHPTMTRRSGGLQGIVAVESLVKIGALLLVAGLGAMAVANHAPPGFTSAQLASIFKPRPLDVAFWGGLVITVVTTATLPRQFHLGFVELEDVGDLKTGRWLFPLYMTIWTAAFVPIVLAANLIFPNLADPGTALLAVAVHQGGFVGGSVALLGGFSAGAAMVMVETVTLSAMVSNEFVLPWLSRAPGRAGAAPAKTIVAVRQFTIVAILVAAWLFALAFGGGDSIFKLGNASMLASAQLAPAMIGAVTWRRGHARGAITGICAGMSIWLVFVVGPDWIRPFWPDQAAAFSLWLEEVRWQVVFGSLALNLGCYVALSLITRPKLLDRIQAASFVSGKASTVPAADWGAGGAAGDLKLLLDRFIGPEDAARALRDIERALGRRVGDADPITLDFARAVERTLTGAVGPTSARSVIALAFSGAERNASEVSQMLDEAAQAVHFSRDLLQTTLDSLDNGVGLIDRDNRLIAWNARYAHLLELPVDELYVGKPFADILHHVGDHIEARDEAGRRSFIGERLDAVASRTPTVVERQWRDGRVLKITGTALASGEYLTSIADITDAVRAARALTDINAALEERVQTRTRELTEANHALALATARAEKVTRSQRRFVAAASHDLLQPLHAARLFLGSALNDLPADAAERDLIAKSDLSIEAADRLLRALMNLSRLELDGLRPPVRRVSILALFAELKREYETPASLAGLELVVLPTDQSGLTDPDLLRSVLQNLISNAIRYTRSGRVVLACRRAQKGALRIEVRDTGPGISPELQPLVFEEFVQLTPNASERSGAGLGLAISRRICEALGHELSVRSQLGAGSTFAVTLPLTARAEEAPQPSSAPVTLNGLRVLCVEDDPYILDATAAILKRWGAEVETASQAEPILAATRSWDVVLADYSLAGAIDGLSLLESLSSRAGMRVLVTANPDEGVTKAATALGAIVLRKPLGPAALGALMQRARQSTAA